MALITYEDKDNSLPTSNPRRLFRDIDANEIKNVVNTNAGLIVNHWRGDWAGTNALPATGGSGTSGAVAAGNEWRLTNELTIGGNVYAPGTIIKAMTNVPGQTLANWAFLAVQL
jgi:hypothetical protein